MEQKDSNSRYKAYYKLAAFSFLIIVMGMVLLYMIENDSAYSAAEKRSLASRPQISWDTLTGSEFSSDAEKYLTDQVPWRDNWVFLNTSWNKLTGQNLSNHIYQGKQNYLIQKFERPPISEEISNSQLLNKFLNRYADCKSYVMLVPTASEVLSCYLPMAALTDSQREWYDKNMDVIQGKNIQKISLFEYFKSMPSEQSLYYKTDHHWTSEAAFLAFGKLADTMKIEVSEEEWEKTTVCDTFQGTLMSKSGFYSSVMDEIDIFIYTRKDIKIIVNYIEEQKVTACLYEAEALRGDNPYEVFLGGNHPRITIKTNAASSGKLLLLKDSYANCLIPFLVPYFSQIDVIDARYYTENIYQQMEAGRYTDILVLYNIETYSSDTALGMILKEDESYGE